MAAENIGFINPTLAIEGKKYKTQCCSTKPNVVEDNIEVYKLNVDLKTYYSSYVVIKTYCFFTTQHWWGQHRMKNPNVDIKTYCFFITQCWWGQHWVKKTNVDLETYCFFTTQCWCVQHWVKKTNVDLKTCCFFTTQHWWAQHWVKKTNVAKNTLEFKITPKVGIKVRWKKPMLT